MQLFSPFLPEEERKEIGIAILYIRKKAGSDNVPEPA